MKGYSDTPMKLLILKERPPSPQPVEHWIDWDQTQGRILRDIQCQDRVNRVLVPVIVRDYDLSTLRFGPDGHRTWPMKQETYERIVSMAKTIPMQTRQRAKARAFKLNRMRIKWSTL